MKVKIRIGNYKETPYQIEYAKEVIINIDKVEDLIYFGTDTTGKEYTFKNEDIIEHIS